MLLANLARSFDAGLPASLSGPAAGSQYLVPQPWFMPNGPESDHDHLSDRDLANYPESCIPTKREPSWIGQSSSIMESQG